MRPHVTMDGRCCMLQRPQDEDALPTITAFLGQMALFISFAILCDRRCGVLANGIAEGLLVEEPANRKSGSWKPNVTHHTPKVSTTIDTYRPLYNLAPKRSAPRSTVSGVSPFITGGQSAASIAFNCVSVARAASWRYPIAKAPYYSETTHDIIYTLGTTLLLLRCRSPEGEIHSTLASPKTIAHAIDAWPPTPCEA